VIDPIRVSIVVPAPIARAFDHFARRLHSWWPREYTWSQDVLRDIGIEPRVGGLCFEIGPHDFRCDWGRVLAWSPPERLQLAWHISPRREPVPDPSRASSVSVRFAELEAQRTRVSLVHDDFGRHGSGAAEYRAAMASPEGWPFILRRCVETTT